MQPPATFADANAEHWTADACADYLSIARNTWHRYYKRVGVKNPVPQPEFYVGRTPVWRRTDVVEWAANRYRAVNS